MPPTLQRTFARTVQDYLAAAQEVVQFCAVHDLAGAISFKVRLILEELVLNLIDHAIDPATNRIDLRIEIDPDRVILTLEDDSGSFDPRSVPAFDKTKPLESRGPRGMGIQLVRTMANDIFYERVNGRNRLQVCIRRD